MSRILPYSPPLNFDLSKVEEANEILNNYRQALVDQARASLITCTTDVMGKGCGHKQEIGSTVYIMTHYYVEPHGCTGGDYWKEDEGRFKCDNCGKITRLYDCPEIERLKGHFKQIERVYDK